MTRLICPNRRAMFDPFEKLPATRAPSAPAFSLTRRGDRPRDRFAVRRWRRLDGEPEPVGDRRGFDAAGGTELAEDVRYVHARGLSADEQLVCDLLVGPATSDHVEYLRLALGQAEDVPCAIPRGRGLGRSQIDAGETSQPLDLAAERGCAQPNRNRVCLAKRRFRVRSLASPGDHRLSLAVARVGRRVWSAETTPRVCNASPLGTEGDG